MAPFLVTYTKSYQNYYPPAHQTLVSSVDDVHRGERAVDGGADEAPLNLKDYQMTPIFVRLSLFGRDAILLKFILINAKIITNNVNDNTTTILGLPPNYYLVTHRWVTGRILEIQKNGVDFLGHVVVTRDAAHFVQKTGLLSGVFDDLKNSRRFKNSIEMFFFFL